MRSDRRATMALAILATMLVSACHVRELLTAPEGPPPGGGGPDDPPAALFQASVASGDAQSDSIAATLPSPYAVRVVDAEGTPQEGLQVAWRVLDGGGSVSPAQTVTDADGIARATHTLGTTLGWQRVAADVAAADASVRFASFARHGAVHSLAYEVAPSDAAMDQPISPAIRVVLRDRVGNPVEGAGGHADVTLVEGTGTPLAELRGTLRVPVASGRAVFADVRVSLAGSGYRLRVTTAGRAADSPAFDVTLPILP